MNLYLLGFNALVTCQVWVLFTSVYLLLYSGLRIWASLMRYSRRVIESFASVNFADVTWKCCARKTNTHIKTKRTRLSLLPHLLSGRGTQEQGNHSKKPTTEETLAAADERVETKGGDERWEDSFITSTAFLIRLRNAAARESQQESQQKRHWQLQTRGE